MVMVALSSFEFYGYGFFLWFFMSLFMVFMAVFCFIVFMVFMWIWIAIWILLLVLDYGCKFSSWLSKILALFILQIPLTFSAWMQQFLPLWQYFLMWIFLSVEILGKICYSLPVILQMVSSLGVSKSGKHKASTLTKFKGCQSLLIDFDAVLC